MRFCNIITLAIGLAQGINARPISTDFGLADVESQCFARCMSRERECRAMPGTDVSGCTSTVASCKPSCSRKRATSNSTPTSTDTSMSTSTPTSTPTLDTEPQCVGSSESSCPQSATAATPTPSATAPPGDKNSCHDQCQAIHGKCRADQGADAAKCESNLKGCTWLCPLDGLGQSE